MGFLVVVALAGLIVLWLQHRQLVARVYELEKEVGLGEETGAVLPTPRAETPPVRADAAPAALVPVPPPPAHAAAQMDASNASLIGAAPAAPDAPRVSPADQLGGWFERYVGGRLLIWIGGIALAVAGVLIVRFSVGLITPAVRLGLAAALGVALVVGGEIAHRQRGAEVDPRIAQALVGAGILVLY